VGAYQLNTYTYEHTHLDSDGHINPNTHLDSNGHANN
jgi:hypothetical protein